MAKDLGSLKDSIVDWLSEASKEQAGRTTRRVTSGKMSELAGIEDLKERMAAAQQMGLDPDTAKSINDHLKDTVKLNSSLTRLMLEQGIQFKDAVKILKKQKMELRGTSQISELQYRRQVKVLNLLEKEYKAQRKIALIKKTLKGLEPAIGKTSSRMLSHALTGKGVGPFDKQVSALSQKMPKFAKMFAVAGRVIGGALGLVVGAIHGSAVVLVKGVKTLFDSMNKIFDQGIEGILNSVVDMAQKLGSVFSNTLGGIIGSLGSLLIKRYMMMLEISITRSQIGAKTAFRTGRGPEAGEGMYNAFLKETGGIRSLAKEWAEEFSRLGDIGDKAFQQSVYRTATMFQQTTGQAFEDLNRLLMVNNNNFKTAGKEYDDAISKSRYWAKQTKVNAEDIKNTFLDTAVATRYLNTDLKSVEGTISILAKNQEALQKAGISLKKDLGNITKGIQEIPGAWDYAQHALIGMRKYGAENVPEGYVRSRFNLSEKQKLTYEQGTFGITGMNKKDEMMARQGVISATGWDKRIAGMREHLAEVLEKRGVKQGTEEAFIIGQEFYKDVYKVNSEQLRVALLMSKDYNSLSDENKNLLRNQGKSAEVLLSQMDGNLNKLYTVSQKTEQWQMAIAGMIPLVIALLRLLPSKIASFLPGAETFSDDIAAGTRAFDNVVETLRRQSTGMESHVKGFMKPFFEGLDLAEGEFIKELIKRKGGKEKLIAEKEKAIKGAKVDRAITSFVNIGTQWGENRVSDAERDLAETKEKIKRAEKQNKIKGTKHFGGMANAGDWYKLQVGEAISDEFFFMSPNKSVDVKSKANVSEELAKTNTPATNITNSGSTTYINITVPSSNPDEVADALRAHLAKIS